jgi:hypothetical protein
MSGGVISMVVAPWILACGFLLCSSSFLGENSSQFIGSSFCFFFFSFFTLLAISSVFFTSRVIG